MKTYWHFDHVVEGWNTPELRMKTCEVMDSVPSPRGALVGLVPQTKLQALEI